MSGSSKLDDVVCNCKLLKKELAEEFKRKNFELVGEMQMLQSEKDDLEAAKLELQADRLDFEAKMQELEITGGSSSDTKLKYEKAALKAERALLEAEKTQLRVSQSQLKAAQSQLEDAKSQLELAQSQLDGARAQLETAQEQLEAAKAEAAIDGKKLKLARTSLEAAKVRFAAATKQMNAAKSRFESAKTLLEAAAVKKSECAVSNTKDDELAEMKIRISELEACKSRCEIKTAKLENEKLNLATELCERKLEVGSLFEKVKELEKHLDESRKDKETTQGEVVDLEQQLNRCRDEKKAMQDENEKVKPNISPVLRKYENPKVYFDLTVRGEPMRRLVFELDSLISQRHLIDIFCALCTGGNGVDSKGVPPHYKGSMFVFNEKGYNMVGGGDTVENDLHELVHNRGPENSMSVYSTGDLIVPSAPRADGRCFFSIQLASIYLSSQLMAGRVKIGRVTEGASELSELCTNIIKTPGVCGDC